MDPIRTAVKYSLIPLRTIVQVGEAYLQQDEEPQRTAPEPASRPRKRATTSAKRRPAPRKQAADPQRTQVPKDLDDVGLARKVETVIFRDASVPKGKIDVNAADGVVWLRGEAKTPDMIKMLEAAAARIPEVKKVENLLHLPKTPAPTRTDTPASQRKTRRSPARPNTQKVHQTVTNEGVTARGEKGPETLAQEGEGRQPAPLGSSGKTA